MMWIATMPLSPDPMPKGRGLPSPTRFLGTFGRASAEGDISELVSPRGQFKFPRTGSHASKADVQSGHRTEETLVRAVSNVP